jgi:hypothetical protein
MENITQNLSRELKRVVLIHKGKKVMFDEFGPAYHYDYCLIIGHKLPLKKDVYYYAGIYKQDEQTKQRFNNTSDFFCKIKKCYSDGREEWVDTEFFNSLDRAVDFVLNTLLDKEYKERDPKLCFNEFYFPEHTREFLLEASI